MLGGLRDVEILCYESCTKWITSVSWLHITRLSWGSGMLFCLPADVVIFNTHSMVIPSISLFYKGVTLLQLFWTSLWTFKVFVYFHPEKMHLLKILKQKIKLIHIEFFNCASGNAIIFWSGKYSCRWTMFIVYFRNMISPAGPLPKCSPANFYFYLFSRQKYFCDGEDFGFGNTLYLKKKKHTVIINS